MKPSRLSFTYTFTAIISGCGPVGGDKYECSCKPQECTGATTCMVTIVRHAGTDSSSETTGVVFIN